MLDTVMVVLLAYATVAIIRIHQPPLILTLPQTHHRHCGDTRGCRCDTRALTTMDRYAQPQQLCVTLLLLLLH